MRLSTTAKNKHKSLHLTLAKNKPSKIPPKITKKAIKADFRGHNSPPSRVPEEMEPCFPGRCSMRNFTAPSVSLPVGTSQPYGQEEVCKPLPNLFRAPLINCRSQSSGYHELSRILIIINSRPWAKTSFSPTGILNDSKRILHKLRLLRIKTYFLIGLYLKYDMFKNL